MQNETQQQMIVHEDSSRINEAKANNVPSIAMSRGEHIKYSLFSPLQKYDLVFMRILVYCITNLKL
jgi:hypothetical protein